MSINDQPRVCEKSCLCGEIVHDPIFIVLTGGPGAGKTAVLEIIRKQLCEHVAILPEAASVIFGGGFWRMDSVSARQAAQNAIMSVQREMENLVIGERKWSIGLCDRGIPDGFAYWPMDGQSFWNAAGMTLQDAYDRYYSVIHLRSPSEDQGYNHQNPLRVETAKQAEGIDKKIHDIWLKHPRYHQIKSTPEFLDKAHTAMEYIINDLPECCRKSFE